MEFKEKQPPREFQVGRNGISSLFDCGNIRLEADEQVTFKSNGKEYDVVRKSWGYYATPSLNGRLARFGFVSCLCRSQITGHLFLLLVETEKQEEFENYIRSESMAVVSWLHGDGPLTIELE